MIIGWLALCICSQSSVLNEYCQGFPCSFLYCAASKICLVATLSWWIHPLQPVARNRGFCMHLFKNSCERSEREAPLLFRTSRFCVYLWMCSGQVAHVIEVFLCKGTNWTLFISHFHLRVLEPVCQPHALNSEGAVHKTSTSALYTAFTWRILLSESCALDVLGEPKP